MRRLVMLGLVLVLLAACTSESSQTATTTKAAATDYRLNLLAFPHDPPQALPALPLIRSDGTPFDLGAPDKLTIVYFGFTACPDVCPTTLIELRKAYLELGQPRDKLNIVFVTIDPERDTPENIERYLATFHSDFIGLTGDADQLKAARDTFEVVAIKVELPDSALGYTMDHTADIFVISPQGAYIARFVHGATATTLAHDFRLFLEHES